MRRARDIAETAIIRKAETSLINRIDDEDGKRIFDAFGLDFYGMRKDLNEILL